MGVVNSSNVWEWSIALMYGSDLVKIAFICIRVVATYKLLHYIFYFCSQVYSHCTMLSALVIWK